MIKRSILCIIAVVTISTIALAKPVTLNPEKMEIQGGSGHKINGYKYLCMEEQGNLYNLEDKFNAFFESIGFIIITPDDEEELDEEERVYVLYGSYVHNAVQDALNNTTLTLRNKDGKIIFSCTKESACFISVKRCAEKGYDKIIQEIKKLNYSFDPTLVHKGNKKKNNASVEQDSVSMVPEQTMEDE